MGNASRARLLFQPNNNTPSQGVKLSNIAQAETEIIRSLERAARLRQAILKRAFEGRLV